MAVAARLYYFTVISKGIWRADVDWTHVTQDRGQWSDFVKNGNRLVIDNNDSRFLTFVTVIHFGRIVNFLSSEKLRLSQGKAWHLARMLCKQVLLHIGLTHALVTPPARMRQLFTHLFQ
jgi:hypothetical protein